MKIISPTFLLSSLLVFSCSVHKSYGSSRKDVLETFIQALLKDEINKDLVHAQVEKRDPCDFIPAPRVENAEYEILGVDRVEYECNSGYEMVDPSKAVVDCSAGFWLNLPVCQITSACGPAPEILHGEVITFSAIKYYRCDPGYTLKEGATGQTITCQDDGNWETPEDCKRLCLTTLRVMAFTSNLNHAGTNNGHGIELQVNGLRRDLELYDRPGDDALKNKGDLWEFSLSSFNFPVSCITNIEKVYIVERSNDGWNIESIVTIVENSLGAYQLLTQDFGANHWIDGDSEVSYRHFELTHN